MSIQKYFISVKLQFSYNVKICIKGKVIHLILRASNSTSMFFEVFLVLTLFQYFRNMALMLLKRCFNVIATLFQLHCNVASTSLQRWFSVIATLSQRWCDVVSTLMQRCFNVETATLFQRWDVNVDSTFKSNLFSTLFQR